MNTTDIAALEILAQPNPTIKHTVSLKNIDVKWLHGAAVHQQLFETSGKLNLMNFNEEYYNIPDRKSNDLQVLIDSPRSAIVILKNGCTVEQLCRTSIQKYRSEALIEGLEPQLMQLRIDHDEKKRQAYLSFLREEYTELCGRATSHGDIIQRMYLSERKMATEFSPARNIGPLYASPGKLPMHILNEENFAVLRVARSRAEDEVHRLLSLRQRLQGGSKLRERASQLRASRAEHEVEIRNDIKVQELREKGLLIAERYKCALERAQRLKKEKADKVERARVTIESREEKLAQRLVALNAGKAEENRKIFDEKRRVMKQKKEQVDQDNLNRMLEADAKRKELERIKAQEMMERQIAIRALQQVKTEKVRERKSKTKELYDAIEESRRAKLEQSELATQKRRTEFEEMKRSMMEMRKDRHEKKEEKRHNAKEKVIESEKQRLHEMLTLIEEKDQHVASVISESQWKNRVAQEESRLKSEDRKNELLRRSLIRDFELATKTYLYEERNQRNLDDMKRRKVLHVQVRQERDAILRAKDKILQDMEASDVKRRKDDNFKMCNKLLDITEGVYDE